MKNFLTDSNRSLSRGFTLIELLIVIAVLGILAAATLAVLDPIDKINAGNDSKVQSDITAVAQAAEAYAVSHDGTYPSGTFATAVGMLVTSGDLRSIPTPPGGYTAPGYVWTGGGSSTFSITGPVKSKKYVTTATTYVFKYTSATGKSCTSTTANAGNNCP